MKKVFCCFLLFGTFCFSQVKQDNQFYFKPEFLIGKMIPSYELFTGKNPKTVIGFSLVRNNYNPKKNWQQILNYPKTGISLYFTNYGKTEKGNSITVFPYLEFFTSKSQRYSLKFAIGASYFTKQYDEVNNPEFKEISTQLTWSLQAGIYHKIVLKSGKSLALGLVYFHHSNGHTKLPNEGFNTASLSVSSDFQLSHSNNKISFSKNKIDIKKFNGRFIAFRYGKGFQVMQESVNKIKQVDVVSISGGLFYKEIVRLSTGFTYRFYHHYYDYIKENNLDEFNTSPVLNASNVYVFVGAELLFGNIGVDWQGGLNLYKPFYKTHYQLDGKPLTFKYQLKKMFLGRLGLKLYAISTQKKPKYNMYLAGNINSNLSQADFSEISVGIVRRLR